MAMNSCEDSTDATCLVGQTCGETIYRSGRQITLQEYAKLETQNSRLVSEFQARKLEVDAMKNWDLFYKRNETRFFKDRHWTTREFEELFGEVQDRRSKILLEVGCGVGNLIFPLLESGTNIFIYACDFSQRAIELVKSNPLYCEKKVKAFQVDITTDAIFGEVSRESIDIVTMVFVLSAIHPTNFTNVLKNIFSLLQPGGIFLFRDYGLYDMAQLRFRPGNKIAENFYMRQDGTRSYYFSVEELQNIFTDVGFTVIQLAYTHRRTVNKKEGVDVPRTFVQAKLHKPK